MDNRGQVMIVSIKVISNAPKNEYVGKRNDEYVFKIQAQPQRGRANTVLIEFLSVVLKTAKSNISIISGQTSQHKKLKIDGVPESTVLEILSK